MIKIIECKKDFEKDETMSYKDVISKDSIINTYDKIVPYIEKIIDIQEIKPFRNLDEFRYKIKLKFYNGAIKVYLFTRLADSFIISKILSKI